MSLNCCISQGMEDVSSPLPFLSSVGASVSSIPMSCGTPFHSVNNSLSSNMSFSSVEISLEIETNSA